MKYMHACSNRWTKVDGHAFYTITLIGVGPTINQNFPVDITPNATIMIRDDESEWNNVHYFVHFGAYFPPSRLGVREEGGGRGEGREGKERG